VQLSQCLEWVLFLAKTRGVLEKATNVIVVLPCPLEVFRVDCFC